MHLFTFHLHFTFKLLYILISFYLLLIQNLFLFVFTFVFSIYHFATMIGICIRLTFASKSQSKWKSVKSINRSDFDAN